MTEAQWVIHLVGEMQSLLPSRCEAIVGKRLSYGLEAVHYVGDEPEQRSHGYQTDILIVEWMDADMWKPRVVIEAKLAKVTTHDAITYSQKAATHKAVHPYLRYGIVLGDRKHYPLPGRLFRHGAHFDFMYSFAAEAATSDELATFVSLIEEEVEASRTLEHILYESRRPGRDRYTLLQRRLVTR